MRRSTKRKRNSEGEVASKPRKARRPNPEPEIEDENAGGPEYKVRNIIDENKTRYLVDWEAINGEEFAPTWEPKSFVNQIAIDDWEEKKRLKEEANNDGEEETGRPSGVGRSSTAGRPSGTGRSSVAGHLSVAGRPSTAREVVQIDDDEDNDEEVMPLKKKSTTSASKPSVVLKIKRRSNPVVEVSPAASKLPASSKTRLTRPRTSLQLPQDDDEDVSTPAPTNKSVDRPRMSLPGAAQQERDQDGDGEDSADPQPRRPGMPSRLNFLGRQARRRTSSLPQEDDNEAGPSAGLAGPRGSLLSRPPKDDIKEGPSRGQQAKRKPRRPSPSLFVRGSSEDEVQDESFNQGSASDPLSKPPVKPLRDAVYKIPSDDDDSDVPLKLLSSRQRRAIAESSDDEIQHVEKRVQHAEPTAAPKKGRGRPRKYPLPAHKDQEPKRPRGRPRKTPVIVAPSAVTPAASRIEEVGTTEINDSEIFNPAAAQVQGEVRSTRKTSPRQRKLSPEFEEEYSEFRPSQVLTGTQPEPARPEELTATIDNLGESEVMVDAGAASSLSQKNSPYEPEITSESVFDSNNSSTSGMVINSSSGVHTLPAPLARRFGANIIIPDSQSYLDASSVHISEHQFETAAQVDVETENYEDASTESQVAVVEQTTTEQQTEVPEHDVPESSMAQMPEDPRLPNAAAATQSEPSTETSTQDNIINGSISIAASSPIAQVPEHISTRSALPVSVGAARSNSTSSAPPTEVADKSTQSQHSNNQLGSSSQNYKRSLQPQPTSAPESNRESDQNSESIQVSTIISQQQQAAQQVSFQQLPEQPRLALDFLQSSVEQNTASSSSGFLTQIVPGRQLPPREALGQEAPNSVDLSQKLVSAQSSSSFPTLPSQFPNTIGESAPSHIRSVSESALTRSPSQTPNMSTSGSSDIPKLGVAARLKAMRAAKRAEYDLETERLAAVRAASRAASSAPALPDVVAPVRPALVAPATVPAIEVLSPKPASAVPARLMSPAMADRETRSPSTVPPVEIVPEETPEEYSRSERYETLLPGEGPQINSNNSRNVVSQDSAMPDASLDDGAADNNQHVVSIDFGVSQRDYYKCSFNDKKALVDEFTLRVWPEDADIAEQARAYICTLHNYINHLDLNDPDTANSTPIPPENQVQWDTSMSAKFNFLRSLLYAAKAHNLHVALLIDPGRFAAILQTFLQGIDIMYNVIDGQNNVVNQHSTATILLTSVYADPDLSSLELDMLVIIDGSTPSKVITRTQQMLSSNSPLPAISLVIPRSIEHAVRCIPAAMSEAERLHVLLSTATNERLRAGWVSGGADADYDRKASDIISWILNPAESDWLAYGLPELQLVEALSSQPSSEDELMAISNESNGKRTLDEFELPMAKKARMDEPLPLTINPADMHLPSGTMPVSHSHVSDSVVASQHAVTKQQLSTARRQVSEYEQAMERLQFDSEEQRASMVQAQLERNRALEREESLKKANLTLQDKNIALREEVLDLKTRLESAYLTLANHTVPERAEIEQSLAEARAAIAEKEKEARRAKTAEDQVEYLRDQYQTRSNDVTLMAASNAEQEKRIAELEIRASGEQAKLRTINLDSHAKKLQSSWNKTKAELAAKEAHCQNLSEENARLLQRGRGVSTRATSMPRSRQGSPVTRPRHPLSKGSPA